VDDVDSLHVQIDDLNDSLVGFFFIRSIDSYAFFIKLKKQLTCNKENWQKIIEGHTLVLRPRSTQAHDSFDRAARDDTQLNNRT
jgi:hypothetical protein